MLFSVPADPVNISKRLLEKLEKRDRGYYAAPCGLLNRFGGDLLVGLRSGFLSQTKKRLFLYAGAGIISESRVEDELMEMILKMKQFRVFLTSSSFIENLSLGMGFFLTSLLKNSRDSELNYLFSAQDPEIHLYFKLSLNEVFNIVVFLMNVLQLIFVLDIQKSNSRSSSKFFTCLM